MVPLNGGPLKLADKFTFLGSSVSSYESYVNIGLVMAWTDIDYTEVWSTR